MTKEDDSVSDRDITHREIYDRVVSLEHKVDELQQNTTNVVAAFTAAQGAFTVLDWLAKAAKPLLWLAGIGALLVAAWEQVKGK